MKKLFFAFLVLASSSASALLPPLYQSINEYKALLENEQLPSKLSSGETILAIKRLSNSFEIITNQRKLFVKIVYEPQERPGPAKFHLEFSPISR